MEGVVTVKVGSGRPLFIYSDRLCAHSGYFRTALQGGFSESAEKCIDIPWAGNTTNCELFLQWLGLETPESSFNSSCAIQFLNCCAYFQVSEDCWDLVQKQLEIPASYNQATEELKTVWIRQTVPFAVMKTVVERVPSKVERVVFILAWFNEKAATTPSDKRALETCEDFFLMRDLITASFLPSQPQYQQLNTPAASSFGRTPTGFVLFGETHSVTPTLVPTRSSKPGAPAQPVATAANFGGSSPNQSILGRFAPYPAAANSIETVWLLQQLSSGGFQS